MAGRTLGGIHVYVQNSGLPKALVDLVFLRASQINGCAYCIDLHSRDLIKGGTAVEKVMLVSAWREAGSPFTARERVGLINAYNRPAIGFHREPGEEAAA